MTPDARARADVLAADLRAAVADRLHSLVVYGAHAASDRAAADAAPLHALAVIDALSLADLDALTRRAAAWGRRGIATPLLIAAAEFPRSFDAFPLEFGAITAQYVVVAGRDPFDGLQVDTADLRRACEVQVRGHLLHLREGYLESGGTPNGIGELVARSAAPLRTLLVNLALLAGAPRSTIEALAAHAARVTVSPASVFADVLALASPHAPAADAARLFPAYLAAVERIAEYVDRWSARE